MGLVNKESGKKNIDDWEGARYAEPNLQEGLGFFWLVEEEKTVFPKAPQNKYSVYWENVPAWRMFFAKKEGEEYTSIGHADYFSVLKKLEAFILDSDESSVLVRGLTLEELGSLVEVPVRTGYYYAYSAELPEDIKYQIERTFEKAVKIFKISNSEDGEVIATQLLKIVDHILETGEFPVEYGDMMDVAVALGVLFGQALCNGYGWTWKVFGASKDDTVFGVVSPEENFCNAPLLYLNKILSGQNIGLDGRNDNTVLLLYNMLKDIDQRPEDVKYFPLA